MKVGELRKELEKFDDDDHIEIGGEAWSWVPKIEKICGGTMQYMGYYCINEPGHLGDCYCGCKSVEFEADNQ